MRPMPDHPVRKNYSVPPRIGLSQGSKGPACPNCAGRSSSVIDTRTAGVDTRRRRVCMVCKRRFTTLEHCVEPMVDYQI
jgi:hypothetical protein